MKRKIAVLLTAAALGLCAFSGCSSSGSGSAPAAETSAPVAVTTQSSQKTSSLADGWTTGADSDTLVTEKQEEIFQDALNSYEDLKMKPVALLAKQVVAGTNYVYLCYDMTRTENPTASWDIVVAYEDLYGKAKLTSIIEVHPYNIRTSDEAAQELASGNWQIEELSEGVTLEDGVAAALDSVMEKEYLPIALLGSKEGENTEHVLLVQEKNGDDVGIYVVDMTVSKDGDATLVSEKPFDLYYYLNVNY